MGRIYYATNRNPDNSANPTGFGIDFNGAQPGALTFGTADVASPAGHDAQGLPFEATGPGSVQLSQPKAGDFSDAAKRAILGGPPHLVISIHGFQYLFWEAIVRADYLSRWFAEGQFANPNTIIAFTWPSAGVLSEYQRDWNYSTNSAGALAQTLTTVKPLIDAFRAKHGAAARVTLLAHGMGNHMLNVGLGAVTVTSPPTYNRIILAAADEGRNQLAPGNNLAKARELADRVYVYYNNQDLALAASALVEHGPGEVRLGVDGPPNKDDFKNSNVTFMNASVAGAGPTTPENSYDSENHQYYRMIQEVRNDICAVMRGMADSAIPNRIYRDDPHYNWENYWRIDRLTASVPREGRAPIRRVPDGANRGGTVQRAGPSSPTERNQLLRPLDEIEAALREIEPLLPEFQKLRSQYPGGMGHNNPPEPILEVEFDELTVKVGIQATNVFRTQISSPKPAIEVLELCGTAFEQLLAWAKIAIHYVGQKTDRLINATIDSAGKVAGPILFVKLTGLTTHLPDIIAWVRRFLSS